MKIWVAGNYGGWSSERMTAALKKLRVDSTLFSLSECSLDINAGIVKWKDTDLSTLDGIVVRKLGDPVDPLTPYRVNLLYQLANKGVKIFSNPQFIDEVNDRYKMTMKLANAGVPVPETVITESFDEAADLVDRWGKAVVKPIFTSKGRGMMLLDKEGTYRLDLKHWSEKDKFPYYVQRYVKASHDIGVAVMGTQILGAFQRVSGNNSWQTTIRTGGHYEVFNPDSAVKEIVSKITSLFKFDYTVIDFVAQGDSYLVYEVSAFGGFSGLWACGIDAASILARYLTVNLVVPGKRNARIK